MKFKLRYICILLTLSWGCLSLTAQTNKEIRSLQREQKTLKKNIDKNNELLISTKKDVNSQMAGLQVISAKIEGQQKQVDSIHAEVTQLGTGIRELEGRLKLLERDLSECKRHYRRAVAYMFRNRMQVSKWRFILSAKSFRQMYRRMRYVNEFSKYQVAQGRIIRQKEEVINAKRNELLGKRTEKNRLLEAGKAEKQKLQGQHAERQKVVDELNKKQKQLQASLTQQRKQYNNLNARIDQLIQKEIAAAERRRKAEAERRRQAELAKRKRQQEEARAAAKRQASAGRKKTASASSSGGRTNKSGGKSVKTSAKGSKYDYDAATATPDFSAADNAERTLSNSFAANKGRLPMPITGPYAITGHYGQYNVQGLRGVQLENKGVNITGHAGAQARAVFNGEVSAIFTYGGMYNIIVRHGSYMSVYCNLATTSVRQGQQVSTRQTLGTVARDASGNCTLQFQLRKETARLNPEVWLAR